MDSERGGVGVVDMFFFAVAMMAMLDSRADASAIIAGGD